MQQHLRPGFKESKDNKWARWWFGSLYLSCEFCDLQIIDWQKTCGWMSQPRYTCRNRRLFCKFQMSPIDPPTSVHAQPSPDSDFPGWRAFPVVNGIEVWAYEQDSWTSIEQCGQVLQDHDIGTELWVRHIKQWRGFQWSVVLARPSFQMPISQISSNFLKDC